MRLLLSLLCLSHDSTPASAPRNTALTGVGKSGVPSTWLSEVMMFSGIAFCGIAMPYGLRHLQRRFARPCLIAAGLPPRTESLRYGRSGRV